MQSQDSNLNIKTMKFRLDGQDEWNIGTTRLPRPSNIFERIYYTGHNTYRAIQAPVLRQIHIRLDFKSLHKSRENVSSKES